MPHRLMVFKGTKTPCQACGGTMQCSRCGGEGEVRTNNWGYEDCEQCAGSGRCGICQSLFLSGEMESAEVWEVYGADESQWPLAIRNFTG